MLKSSLSGQNVAISDLGSTIVSEAAGVTPKQGNTATRGVQTCLPKRFFICTGSARRPLAIALSGLRFSLSPVRELTGLEKIYASVCPDAVAALHKKMAVLLSLDHPAEAERQAMRMKPHEDPDLLGANALIALHEAIKLLRASNRLTSGKIDSLCGRLQALDMLYQERVPDRIVSALEVDEALGVTYYFATSRAGRLPDSVMGLPGLVMSALFHPCSVGENIDDRIYEPIGKQFGHNLNHLLTFLPPRRIEIGAGRGLLSAVLNACVDESGIGKKVLYASDKNQIDNPWPGIGKVLKLSAEKIIEKYKLNPFKKQVIYLCASPEREMINGIIATREPVLLLVASEIYGIRSVSLGVLAVSDNMNRQDLAIVPGRVGGGVLLGLNMDRATFRVITARIPVDYKLG